MTAKNTVTLLFSTLCLMLAAPSVSAQSMTTGAVMDQASQAAITPDQALQHLRHGNERFVAGALTQQDIRAEVAATADGQYPHTFVLSCLDSRVPVEMVFDAGIGDMFVGRVAGNIVDEHMLGSMEFGVAATGSKLIVVMGHSSCGAVKGACDGVDLGHITRLVESIQPSVEAATPPGESCDSSKHEHVQAVVDHNIDRTDSRHPAT
jgi:carbonic anhydrase